jgi:hypothetical protein
MSISIDNWNNYIQQSKDNINSLNITKEQLANILSQFINDIINNNFENINQLQLKDDITQIIQNFASLNSELSIDYLLNLNDEKNLNNRLLLIEILDKFYDVNWTDIINDLIFQNSDNLTLVEKLENLSQLIERRIKGIEDYFDEFMNKLNDNITAQEATKLLSKFIDDIMNAIINDENLGIYNNKIVKFLEAHNAKFVVEPFEYQKDLKTIEKILSNDILYEYLLPDLIRYYDYDGSLLYLFIKSLPSDMMYYNEDLDKFTYHNWDDFYDVLNDHLSEDPYHSGDIRFPSFSIRKENPIDIIKELLEQGFDKQVFNAQEGYDKYITNIVYSNNSYSSYNNTKEVLYNYIILFIKYGVNLNIESIFISNLSDSDIDSFDDIDRYYEKRGNLLDVISQVCKSSEYIFNIETTFKYLSDIETNIDINRIIFDYLYITDFKKEINKYADWSNISARKYTIDMLLRDLNIDANTYDTYYHLPNDNPFGLSNGFELKNIDIFRTIKYYSNYLRETFPHPNDDNSYI